MSIFVQALLIGILTGFILAYILLTSLGLSRDFSRSSYRDFLRDFQRYPLAVVNQGSENRSADRLAKEVRVLCWIMTQPSNHKSKAEHVKATWGKRCNKLIFMSTEEDSSLPAVKLPVKEGRNYLWAKTKAAFRYVYEHHRREADWFMKADDDTYVVVENLRYLLSEHKSTDAIYFGCRFKPFTKQVRLEQGFMSGGAGYVLSRAALERFVTIGLPSPRLCTSEDDGAEDVQMGICLERLGVQAMDSRDSLERGRFFPFTPQGNLFPNKDKTFWYWSYIFYPTDDGLDCCSDHAISFHYVTPQEMYVLDYLIYHLRPYGISYGNMNPAPKEKTIEVNKNATATAVGRNKSMEKETGVNFITETTKN